MRIQCHIATFFLFLLMVIVPRTSQGQQDLIATYKDLHEHPELSHHEERTGAILAGALRDAGFAVTDRVGIYPDGSHAFGIVAIMKNGAGPTLLVRADMEALPIIEETGLPYAARYD